MAQQPIHACRSRSDLRSTSGQRALSLLRRCVSADARAADGSSITNNNSAGSSLSEFSEFSLALALWQSGGEAGCCSARRLTPAALPSSRLLHAPDSGLPVAVPAAGPGCVLPLRPLDHIRLKQMGLSQGLYIYRIGSPTGGPSSLESIWTRFGVT